MILPASLPETIGTYTGFATQEVVRSFLLPYALLVIVLQSFFILRQSADGGHLRRPLVSLSIYLFVSLLLVSLFLPVLPASLRTTPPGDIESAIAAADGSPIRHAGQIQDARGLSAQALGIPPVMYALVEAISNKWLAIATHIHAAALRPHSGLMPLVWLLRYRLSDDVLYDIGYWVRACVNPAKARLSSSGESLSYQDYLPFEGSRLAEEMSLVRRPRHEGVLNLVRPTVTCDVFTRELVQRTLAVIRTDRTPAGHPVAAVWQAELGITSLDAAQWLIMREVQLTLGDHIDGPDLLHTYGLLKGVGTLARALGSLASGFGLWAGLGSAAASGVGDILERVSGPVGAALFFAEYVPVVVGWSQTFLIGFLFPLAVMWGIASPGRQLRPVIIATSILAAAYSLPVVFALTELWTQALRDSSLSLMQNPLLWADTQVKILVIACLGPVGMGLIAVALTTSGYVVSRIVHL